MNVTVLQENLAAGLATVSRGTPGKSTLPVLQNVLLDATDGRLRLTTTNLEIGIHCWLAARVAEPGRATVPTKLLAELVKALPAGAIELETGKANRLVLRTGQHKTNLNTIDPAEFPDVPTAIDGFKIAFEPGQFRTLVERSVYAASADDNRPALTGVQFERDKTGLTLAAADGFRLAVAHLPIDGSDDELPPFLVPARCLSLVAGLLTADEPVIVHVPLAGASRVLFAQESVVVVGQLLADARFPDYRQIVPREWDTRALLPTAELTRAIKTSDLFSKGNTTHPITLDIDPGSEIGAGTCVISAQEASVGDTTTHLDASVDGVPLALGLNARYVLDLLKTVEAEQIALEGTYPHAAVVLRPLPDAAHYCVIMPINIAR